MEILRIEEAAELLHLHPDTLSEMARRGEVPCAKPGKRYIFLKEDLIEWVRSQYGKREKVKETASCPSSSVATFIGSTSATKESVLESLRGPQTRKRRSATTIS